MNKKWLRQAQSIMVALLIAVSMIAGDITPVYATVSEESIAGNSILTDDTYSSTKESNSLTISSEEQLITNDVDASELSVDGDLYSSDNFMGLERDDASGIVIDSEDEVPLDTSETYDINEVSNNELYEFKDSIDLEARSHDKFDVDTASQGKRVKRIDVTYLPSAYPIGSSGFDIYETIYVYYYGDDNDECEEIYLSDPEVRVTGFDSSSIGYKNVSISYGNKTVTKTIYIGQDPENTPICFDYAGFNSIMECVKVISKLKLANAPYISVQKNHVEPTKIVIPKLAEHDDEDDFSGVIMGIKEGTTLTLSVPSITSYDNLHINYYEGDSGELRSENPEDTIIVNYKYNTVKKRKNYDGYDMTYPWSTFGACVSSPGGISFIGCSNIILDIQAPEATLSETKIINISKFAVLSCDGKIYGKLNDIDRIKEEIWLADPLTSSVNIKKIAYDDTVFTLTASWDPNGNLILPQLTVDKIGIKHKEYGDEWWEGSLKLRVVDENGNLISLPSGTTILNRKSAKSDGLDRITIENKSASGKELSVYSDGKAVKVGAANVKVTDGNGNTISYVQLQTALNNMKKGESYTVTIDENISATSLKLPSTQLASLSIVGTYGDHQKIILAKTSSLTANYDLSFEGIAFVTGTDKKGNPNKLTINQKKGTLTFNDVYRTDGVSVKGNSKTSLHLDSGIIKGDITGFGDIQIYSYTWVGGKFSTNNLIIAPNVYIGIEKGRTITAKNVSSGQGSWIQLTPTINNDIKGFKPLELGTVNIDSDYKLKLSLTEGSSIIEGTQILNSKKADLSKFDITDIMPKDGREYYLGRKKKNDSKVYLMAR